jgi:hypothetical protein
MPDDASQWRALIRRQQQCATAAQLAQAARVGATPEPQTMRGAKAVNLRFRTEGATTMQRHAAFMLPPDHPGAHRLEQLHAGGHLDSRQYANACAVLALWIASGLGASAVANYEPREKATGMGDIEQQTAEDELRALIDKGGVDVQAVLMLIRPDAMGAYMWGRALRGLNGLDWLAARWDGEVWRAE